MPPRPKENHPWAHHQTGPLEESDNIVIDDIPKELFEPGKREYKIIWKSIVAFTISHILASYGIYVAFTSAKWLTLLNGFLVYLVSCFGVTAGAHRLWAHRAYKAKWQLRLLLVILQTLAHQNSVISWCRIHRVHHKFQETNADPHNAKRGFFYAHIGWLMCRKHPDVRIKSTGLDMSDLYADPLLRFQHKYFYFLMPTICIILPTVTPMVLWNEVFMTSFCFNILRQLCLFHAACLVNSAAHLWGSKPYDKQINPSENSFVSFLVIGEGWHNYHHTFPWDYKASEFGRLNLTATLINFFAKIGWAYDLKTVSPEMIKARVLRSGDGSHQIWGWETRTRPLKITNVLLFIIRGLNSS